MTPAIEMNAVTFGYGPEATFRFDLTVKPGDIMALMGASGSGKSTLLHLVAGFEDARSGTIRLEGRDMKGIAPAARPLTMVFQENNLFGHLTVEQNVGLGLSPSLRLSSDDRAAIVRALEEVGLAGKAERLPAALSGGERQRVALARAILRDRPILLLDEPFASLGPALRHEMLDLVAALAARNRLAILMVTHAPEDAGRIARTIAFLEAGRVAAIGDAPSFLAGDGPAAFNDYIGK
jgi:thiamine transport system ATP-binding protein